MEKELYKALALPATASALTVMRKCRKLTARSSWRDASARPYMREFMGRMLAIHNAARGPRS